MSGSTGGDGKEATAAADAYRRCLTSLNSAHAEVAKLLAAGSKERDAKKKSGFFKLAVKEVKKLQKVQEQLNEAYKEMQKGLEGAAKG